MGHAVRPRKRAKICRSLSKAATRTTASIHADGDATGRAIEVSLIGKIRNHPNISILENHFAVDLLHHDGECYGLVALDNATGKLLKVEAKATIIATGGIGQIYRETTNPEVATGDGMAMAFRAGATLQDMEFVQFHPTTLYLAGAKRHLITEAVRGEGGHLLNHKGERFMARYDERGELAPRDIVAKSITREMAETGATNVFLSMTHLDPAMIRTRFPNLVKTLAQYKIDPTKDRIPIRPACHYMMGGIRTGHAARAPTCAACLPPAKWPRVSGRARCQSAGLEFTLWTAWSYGHEAGMQALKLAAGNAARLFPGKNRCDRCCRKKACRSISWTFGIR